MRDLLLVNHDNYFRRQGDEIPVRHRELAPVGQAERERCEAILEPLFYLIHNHRFTLVRTDAPFKFVLMTDFLNESVV